jgi:hypothetical protein
MLLSRTAIGSTLTPIPNALGETGEFRPGASERLFWADSGSLVPCRPDVANVRIDSVRERRGLHTSALPPCAFIVGRHTVHHPSCGLASESGSPRKRTSR